MSKVLVYEKSFLGVGLILLLFCLIALVYASLAMGIQLPGKEGLVDPEHITTTPPFDEPGLRQIGANAYEAVVLGYAWGFTPDEIRIPAGSTVTFTATTRDVIHGFHIEKTRVNMMLVPGQITRATHTFEEPGEYLIICHEYCGLAHHAMYARLIVE
ncbi:MAG: cytochrome C oxidase subunit II [Bacteroidetes bacterium]|nr:cytochrome C oxidase subunit II [Rhodothermaceae bacterium RA]RMH54630.1 MAG: cytochrome C oxidase subunit II [Bacteroidota bacterium]